MSLLVGTSEGITVSPGSTGRCGPGTGVIPPPVTPVCVCGITDSFTRVVVDGWGTCDAGLAWFAPGGFNGNFAEVNGSRGILHNATTAFGGQWVGQVASLTLSPAASHDYYVEFQMQDALVPSVTFQKQRIEMRWLASSTFPAAFSIWGDEWALDAGDASASGFWAVNPGTTVHAIRAHVETVAGQTTFSVKMWALSDPEPSGWLATVAATRFGSPLAYDLSGLDLILGPGDTGLISPNAVYFDNLEITGVDRCSEFRWDNFNRTVTSGFGVGDLGEVWSLNFSNQGSSSVDGSNGVLNISYGGGVFGAERMRVLGQINHWTKSLFNPLVVADTFTLSTRLIPAPLPSGQSAPAFMETLIDICSVLHLIVHTETSGSTFYLQRNGSPTKFDSLSLGAIPANTYYTMRMEVSPTNLRGKIWKDGDAEPDWQLQVLDWPTGQDTSSATGNYLEAALQSGLTAGSFDTVTAKIDWIDFEYTGQPCYQNCTTTVLDNFNRTVAAGNPTTTTFWGTASSGTAWVEGLNGNTVSAAVNGAEGTMTLLNNGFDAKSLALPSSITAGTFTVDFKVSALPSGSSTFVQAILGGATLLYYEGVGSLKVAGGATSVPASIAANSYYTLKWEFSPTFTRAKVWSTGSPEPDWQATNTASPPSAQSSIGVRGDWSNGVGGGNGTITWDNLVRIDCTDVFPT